MVSLELDGVADEFVSWQSIYANGVRTALAGLQPPVDPRPQRLTDGRRSSTRVSPTHRCSDHLVCSDARGPARQRGHRRDRLAREDLVALVVPGDHRRDRLLRFGGAGRAERDDGDHRRRGGRQRSPVDRGRHRVRCDRRVPRRQRRLPHRRQHARSDRALGREEGVSGSVASTGPPSRSGYAAACCSSPPDSSPVGEPRSPCRRGSPNNRGSGSWAGSRSPPRSGRPMPRCSDSSAARHSRTTTPRRSSSRSAPRSASPLVIEGVRHLRSRHA